MVDFQLPNLFLAALADARLSSYKLWEKVSLEKKLSCGAPPELNLQTFHPNYESISNKSNRDCLASG